MIYSFQFYFGNINHQYRQMYRYPKLSSMTQTSNELQTVTLSKLLGNQAMLG